MAGTTEILQEYLVKLGYQVDSISSVKFDEYLGKTAKSVLKVGGAVAGLIAGVEAASVSFAYSMRKMYFQSELSQSTVKNLQAMSYAGKQIGIDGEAMGSAIHNMAQALRLNPGLQGLIESFGVKVSGRDVSDVMVDYVRALNQMPEYIGAQYAALFGMDPDTYHQIRNHMEELISKKKEMLGLYKQMGVDPDVAKKTILEYTSALDQLEARISILAQSVLIRLQPLFKKTTDYIVGSINFWTNVATGKQQAIVDSYTVEAGYHAIIDPITNYFKSKSDQAYNWAVKNYAPRGIRNNNPGNLEYVGQAGASLETGVKDPRFAAWKTMTEGNAALADQLDRYVKAGDNTIEKIITKYAPKNENNTKAYIASMSKQLGLNSEDVLDFQKNPQLMQKVMEAIIAIENGPAWVKSKEIEEGIQQSKFGKEAMGKVGTTHVGTQTSTTKHVTINFNPQYNIHGSNAKEVAEATAQATQRLYGDVIRNTKGAVA